MPDGVNFISNIRPVADLIGALSSEPSADNRQKLRERLGRRLSKARWALNRLRDENAKIYIETGGGASDPVTFVQKTKAVLEEQKAAAEQLRSDIDALGQKFANQDEALDQSTAKLVDESRDIAISWLVVIGILLVALWKYREQMQAGTTKEVLHAKPVKGEVDWVEFSREHIARYPKIRARLAE